MHVKMMFRFLLFYTFLMPQLDKISFATQYFWLTLFFFGLYFLTVNFFVIMVFKNLKLRNVIYKIWYFFLYKFDYEKYENKNRVITSICFNSAYYGLYLNFFILLKTINLLSRIKLTLNKAFLLNTLRTDIISKTFNKIVIRDCTNLNNLNNINIDEI